MAEQQRKADPSSAPQQTVPARAPSTWAQWGQVFVTSLLLIFAAFGYFESVKPVAEKQRLAEQVAQLQVQKDQLSKYIAERTERLPNYVFDFYWKKVLAAAMQLDNSASPGPPYSGGDTSTWTTNFENEVERRGVQVSTTRRKDDVTGKHLWEMNDVVDMLEAWEATSQGG